MTRSRRARSRWRSATRPPTGDSPPTGGGHVFGCSRPPVRGGKLRLRLRSDEPVGVRLFVSGMPSGRALVPPARRAKTLVWSLSRDQRREWRHSVRIVFSDAAGNSGGSGP